ncbi:Undecaprenyl-phosphate 4-deoxy-4-formamido-L-arabinose transferase [Paraburkholderia aspalathi]|uniref:glycosyltransferase family 2 protein n=1 Tax=Paraburkholderia aspalathi TaxID=1324617 RepID=UPI00190A0D6C|nr:glycosyltransferase family 2 protein [Paraburkholderia aspalathi]MBK3844282.1 glycosyltransferase family 2 protein [Paraburkholderia aspalathi]CAE6870392.1 Undecaprenyl-phosphate 4-deoxy-4-formamido-L-arabinose transferase [Paraburkholderia aspalathi]
MFDKKVPVSIIIPVFNIQEYLRNCLESIRSQIFSNFEVILVNDGSTDGSLGILNEFCELDGRFKVLNKKNEGLARARQDGFRVACGEYIFNLDGDDFVPPTALENLYQRASELDADIVGGSHQRYSESRGIELVRRGEGVLTRTGLLRMMFSENYFYVWGKLIRRALLWPELPVYDGITYGEDTVLMTQLALRARSIVFVEDIVYIYRVREGSLSNRPNGAAINSRLAATRLACADVRRESFEGEIYDEVNLYFLRQLYRHLKDGGKLFGREKREVALEIRDSLRGGVQMTIRNRNFKMFAALRILRLNINVFNLFASLLSLRNVW